MNTSMNPQLENRVLLLAPTGKDGPLTSSMLQHAGIGCCVCSDLRSLVTELQAGAGVLLVAEEGILDHSPGVLIAALANQPTWSDLSLIVMTLPGAGSQTVVSLLDSGVNITILERPIRIAGLVSSIRGALRARHRQYQTRARLIELESTQKALRDSESDLHDFFEHSPLGMHFVGPDGIIVRANRAELELLGCAHEDFVGHHISEFHVEPVIVEDMLTRLFRGETIHNLAAQLHCCDGSIKYVLISANCLWKDGRFMYARCFTRDVSDSRKVEERDALLAGIVESSDDAIISKNLNGIILSWNRGAERLFGYTAAEAVGQPITLIVPPDRLHEEQAILATLRRGERVDHIETVRRCKNGREVEISVTVSPVRDSSGRIIAASKVARDISERKRVLRALKDADRRKDEFLATLAHELRNPLAPIRNALHVLCLKCDDPTTIRICETMERQVNQIVRLVDDLLEVSRITRGKIELRKEPLELATAIRNAVEMSRPLIDENEHQLAITIPPEPISLEGDVARLAQVISNLLNNSAKYTDRGGQIWLTVRKQTGEAIISVRDTGIGITADLLPHVFETFSQGYDVGMRANGGLGIGLALVKSLVELHGGRVDARSDGANQGSEFTIHLPLATDIPCTKMSSPTLSRHVLPKRRVLVVDDNRDSALTMGLLLEVLGLEAHVVHSGLEAISALESFRPQIALLDIGMPEMDGYELARRIRQQPEWQHLQLIALTGWGQEEDRRRATQMGFDHHLTKPADLGVLESLLMSTNSDQRTPAPN